MNIISQFPENPTNNQKVTIEGVDYKYNSADGVWNIVPEELDIPGGYTSEDFDASLAEKTTDDLTEGASNKYLTGNEFQKNTDTLDNITEGTNNKHFTEQEKSKLSGLESSKFFGQFTSINALQAETGSEGSYAYVDQGIGEPTLKFIWDTSDDEWVEAGMGEEETPSTIKQKYEQNADTNVFTDSEKTKLSGIETGAQVNPGNTDDLSEGTVNKYLTGNEFQKNTDTLDNITEGTNNKHFTSTEKTKLAGVEDLIDDQFENFEGIKVGEQNLPLLDYKAIDELSGEYLFTGCDENGRIFILPAFYNKITGEFTYPGTQAVWRPTEEVTDGNMGIEVLNSAEIAFRFYNNGGDFMALGVTDGERHSRLYDWVRKYNGTVFDKQIFKNAVVESTDFFEIYTFEMLNNETAVIDINNFQMFKENSSDGVFGSAQWMVRCIAGNAALLSPSGKPYENQYSTIISDYVGSSDTRIDLDLDNNFVSIRAINNEAESMQFFGTLTLNSQLIDFS